MLWTNPAVLQQAGVTWNEDTTLDQFVADLPKFSGSGVTALCLGDKDIFASSQLLETVLISKLGPDGWRGLFTGQTPFDSPDVRSAVQTYGTLLGAANTDHTAVTWDQAVVNMTAGKCAATMMGDWAYGEMVNKGKKEGTDFGYLPFPGTKGTYDFVGDAFVIPAENAPNPEAEKTWLSVLLDPQVQKDFNLAKGSAPVRTDVPLDGFPAYQAGRGELAALRADRQLAGPRPGRARRVRPDLRRRRVDLQRRSGRRRLHLDHDLGPEDPARPELTSLGGRRSAGPQRPGGAPRHHSTPLQGADNVSREPTRPSTDPRPTRARRPPAVGAASPAAAGSPQHRGCCCPASF